jgi:RNA polymerase sigma factor (TIGR02999 family)
MGAAARAMRRILIERARRRARLKRGGGGERVTLTDGVRRYEARPEELLSLDVALRDLRARDPAMARVVELRYFGGLTADETAEVLSTSSRTIHRLWSAARAWLHRALETRPSAAPHGGIPGGGGGG